MFVMQSAVHWSLNSRQVQSVKGVGMRAQTTVIPYDEDFVKAYFEMPDEEVDVTRMSPWLLRIELNREMMVRACVASNARMRGF